MALIPRAKSPTKTRSVKRAVQPKPIEENSKRKAKMMARRMEGRTMMATTTTKTMTTCW